MKTGLIILGVCLAVLIIIEIVRQPNKKKEAYKPTIQLTFKETKDGNLKLLRGLIATLS